MKTTSEKRVVIADDHEMFRQGIAGLLEREGYTIEGQAGNGHEAIRLTRQLQPALAILDFSMPLLNGVDATRDIIKKSPGTKVVLLTMYEDDACVIEALKAGVRGYVLKTQAASDLGVALREVQRGSVYLSPGISDAVVKAYVSNQRDPEKGLSDRERQVLQLIAEGHTTRSIASLLFISVKTAESHRSRIMQRLGMHNVASLVRYAIRTGLLKA